MKYCENCIDNINGKCCADLFNKVSIKEIDICKHIWLPFGKYQFKLLQDIILIDPQYIKNLLQNKVEEHLDLDTIEALRNQIPLMIDDILKKSTKTLNLLKTLKKQIINL